MSGKSLSFLTPYLSGSEMMRVHLDSIRRFHSDTPILVSKKGGGADEMEAYRAEFGIRYWLEDCEYDESLMRLLRRCETEYVCILDHDTVLLSSVKPLLDRLAQGQCDLVGIEERIRVPDEIWTRLWPDWGGWLRFAPGYMDATFLMFNLRQFVQSWGLKGLMKVRDLPIGWASETHYGLCEKLTRHHYLLPYHTRKYGMANLLKDGDTDILVHLWYGAHKDRLLGSTPENPDPFDPADSVMRPVVERAERAVVADYPDFDLSCCLPAWAPNCDVLAEGLAIEKKFGPIDKQTQSLHFAIARFLGRVRRLQSHGPRGLAVRILARLGRWWSRCIQ